MPNQFLHSEITFKIRGCCFEIMTAVGSGQKENVYQGCLGLEFSEKKISYQEEPSLPVFYKGKKVGIYKPDFIVEEKVIVELKSIPTLHFSALQQFRQYLRATDYEVGLLINFGQPTLFIHREVWFNKSNVQ